MKYLKALWLTTIDEDVFPWVFLAWVLSGALWFPLGNDVGLTIYLIRVMMTFVISSVTILLSIEIYNFVKLLINKYKSYL